MADETLASLVENLAEAVQQVGDARRACLRGAAERMLAGDRPTGAALPWIREVALDWSYQIARGEQRTVLFFFRSAPRHLLAVEAQLGFGLRPIPCPVTGNPPRLVQLEGALRTPRLLAPPDSADPALMRFRLVPPYGGELVVRYDGGNLNQAEVIWERGDARFEAQRSKPPASAPRRLGPAGRHRPPGPFSNPTRRWSMTPFLAWLESVRDWLAAPERGAQWQSFPLPDPDRDDLPIAQIAVGLIARTYLRTTARAEQPASFGPIRWQQAITNFAGTTRLRLSRDGLTLAQPDEPNPIVLDLDYRARREDNRARLEITARPPDFLLRGDLHTRLIDAFLDGAIASHCGGIFEINGTTVTIDEPALRDLFNQGRDRAFVLRTHRTARDRDINLLVLSGTLDGVALVTLFQAEFTVDPDAEEDDDGAPSPPRQRVRRGPHAPHLPRLRHIGVVQLLRPDPDDGSNDTVRDELVKSLLQFMLALHRWGGLLP